MATRSDRGPSDHPLFDPPRIEEAGRALRKWVDRLLGHADKDDNVLIWETGEPREDERDPHRFN